MEGMGYVEWWTFSHSICLFSYIWFSCGVRNHCQCCTTDCRVTRVVMCGYIFQDFVVLHVWSVNFFFYYSFHLNYSIWIWRVLFFHLGIYSVCIFLRCIYWEQFEKRFVRQDSRWLNGILISSSNYFPE